MSLKSQAIPPVPAETARIAHLAFPKDNLYMKMRDEFGTFYNDEDFARLFPSRGQSAYPPWRLALITVMQFAEGLSDRQAAEAVRARIDWKYALSLELEDAGFDFSILSEFRSRLLENKNESVLLDKMLEKFREKQLLKARGKQRTDSTHILANVRHLNRLESVTETLRAALNAIAKINPRWLYERVTEDWIKEYSRRIEEYRLPKGEAARNEYGSLVASRGFRLLMLIEEADAPAELKELEKVKLLRKMWENQFIIENGKVQFRRKEELPPVNERFDSPYDPEARYGNKRATEWRGYKAHFTETCDEDCPFLITNVETTTAVIPDITMGRAIHESLKKKKLPPKKHLVDSGYVEAKWIAESAREDQIEIIGPVRPNNQWQSKSKSGFALADFAIDWEKKQVTCPEGQTTSTGIRAEFTERKIFASDLNAHNAANARKSRFAQKAKERSLGLANKENHLILEQGRTVQHQASWQEIYNQRAGIEGTFSQAVRSLNFRRSRYIGEKKTHFHNLATAAAINIGRSVAWLEEKPREKTRISWFGRLRNLDL